jgi:hypothetical protein
MASQSSEVLRCVRRNVCTPQRKGMIVAAAN